MEKNNDQIIEEENNIDHLEVKILDAQKNTYDEKVSNRIQFHPFTYFYYIQATHDQQESGKMSSLL